MKIMTICLSLLVFSQIVTAQPREGRGRQEANRIMSEFACQELLFAEDRATCLRELPRTSAIVACQERFLSTSSSLNRVQYLEIAGRYRLHEAMVLMCEDEFRFDAKKTCLEATGESRVGFRRFKECIDEHRNIGLFVKCINPSD